MSSSEKEHTSVNDSKNEHDRLIMKEEYTPVSIISEPTNITFKVVLENSMVNAILSGTHFM